MDMTDITNAPENNTTKGNFFKETYAYVSACEQKRCEASYFEFFKCAWHVLEPATPLVINWHMKVLCDILQVEAERIASHRRKDKDIIINIMPRSAKSSIISKIFPAWVWIKWPHHKFLTSSYSDDLASEHAVACRRLITSPWYQKYWNKSFTLTTDQNIKSFYENDKTGYRISTSTGGTTVGRGGNWCLVDDPISAEQALSEVYLKRCIEWWTQTMYMRLNDPSVDVRIIIMQRLNENDLTGYLLKNQPDKYRHICLPAEDKGNISPAEYGKYYINGLFFPKRFGREFLNDALESMQPYGYAGQMLQNPAPIEGGLFKKEWWKYYDQPPKRFDEVIVSWDMSFKDNKSNSFVVGQAWGVAGVNFYLLKQRRGQWDFVETVKNVRAFNEEFPEASCTLIEDKANGSAVISTLKREIRGIIAITPTETKYARAQPVARYCQAGNIWLPQNAAWLDAFLNEFTLFPNGTNDDQVDCVSQSINYLTNRNKIFTNSIVAKTERNFEIDFKNIRRDSTIAYSLWFEKNMQASAIGTLFNSESRELYVFDEGSFGNPSPEIVLVSLCQGIKRLSKGHILNLQKYNLYANQEAFKNKNSIFLSYTRYQYRLIENATFSEMAAIVLIYRLLKMGKMYISESCNSIYQQLLTWSINNNLPEQGYGLVRALANIVWVLSESGKLEEPKKLKPFSREKMLYMNKLQKLTPDQLEHMNETDLQLLTTPQEERFSWM